jgi:hypothetical protein
MKRLGDKRAIAGWPEQETRSFLGDTSSVSRALEVLDTIGLRVTQS